MKKLIKITIDKKEKRYELELLNLDKNIEIKYFWWRDYDRLESFFNQEIENIDIKYFDAIVNNELKKYQHNPEIRKTIKIADYKSYKKIAWKDQTENVENVNVFKVVIITILTICFFPISLIFLAIWYLDKK